MSKIVKNKIIIDKTQLYSFKRYLLLNFIKYFMSFGIGLFIIFFLYFKIQENRLINQLEKSNITEINELKNEIELTLINAVEDTLVLAHNSDLIHFISDQENCTKLSYNILHFCEFKDYFDQVRIISKDGMELFRVNKNGPAKYSIENKENLQDKSRRYYFAEAQKLNSSNDIYISKLDLNIEHGQIEIPYKPTIRFVAPVYDDNHVQRIGFIVLNYEANDFLNLITDKNMMLLTENGYWVKGGEKKDLWGFMFGNNSTFDKYFHEEWIELTKKREGQIFDAKGLFTFTEIDVSKIFSNKNNYKINAFSAVNKLYLVNHIKRPYLASGVLYKLKVFLLLFFLLLLCLVIISFLIALDITKKNYLKQLLIESQKKYNLAVKSSKFGIWDWKDANSDVQEWGEEFYSLLGYAKGEIEPGFKNLISLIHDNDREKVASCILRTLTFGEKLNEEFRMKCKDGVYKWISGATVLERKMNNSPPRVVGCFFDIDEVKRSEIKKTESEIKMKAIFNNSSNFIWLLSREGKILDVNNTVLNLTGEKATNIVGKYYCDCKALNLNNENKQEFMGKIAFVAKGDRIEYETFLYDKYKNKVPVDFSVRSIKDKNNEIVFILTEAKDISDKTKYLNNLKKINENLEIKVRKRTAKLENLYKDIESKNKRLEKLNELKSKFLSSMSHELRTPLNSILGFSELLTNEYYGKLNEKQEKYLTQILESGKHLLDLINDLLDIAKIDSGKVELNIEDVEPREVIEQCINILNINITQKNIELKTKYFGEKINIQCDRRRLKQIILNLLSNAVKYTDENGKIELFLESNESKIIFKVKDNGIGIKEKDIDKIFQEFRQADSVRDEMLGGIGIGLALTKRLVEMHNGTIEVESGLNKGSTFTFTLPLKQGSEEDCKNNKIPYTLSNRPKNKKILIAEDNDINFQLIKDMLSIDEHIIIRAKNGEKCIELALKEKPDLIFMDMMMPIMNGFEAVRKIKEMKELMKIPVIAMSASTGIEAEEKQRTAGCNDHLGKPISSRKLIEILIKYLK